MANNTVALPRLDSKYISANEYIKNPEIMEEVLDVKNEKNFLNALNNLGGRAVGAQSPIFYHFESELDYRSVGVATLDGGASTTEVIITLTDDSYSQVGSLTGNKWRAPLKATDLVIIPVVGAAPIHAYVISKSDPTPISGSAMNGAFGYGTPTDKLTTYTLRTRVGDTANLRTALTAAKNSAGAIRISAISNAHAEGSYQPIETVDGLNTRYQGQMQIWKTVKPITMEAAAQAYGVPFGGGQRMVNKLHADNLRRHNSDIGWQMMIGAGGTVINLAGEEVPLTKGFTSYVTESGARVPYADADGFTLDDLNDVTSTIKSVRGDDVYFIIAGDEIRPQIETIFRTLNTNTGINYSMWGDGDAKKRMIDFGFDGFRWNGITFFIIEEKTFNHSQVTGLNGLDFRKRAYFVPAGNQKVTYMEGLQQITENLPSIRTRFLEYGGRDMRFKEWISTPETNGGKMEETHNLYSMQGLQMMGLSKFVEVYPTY